MIPDKTAVYTSIFDNYDVLLDPKVEASAVDYICFTDTDNYSSDIWETRIISDSELEPNELNRKVKILAHEFLGEYDYSVYIDGNVQLIGDITDLIERYRKYDFAAPTHFLRDCVYKEGEAMIREKKGDPYKIREQLERYRKEGLPQNVGLSANSTLFRWHTNTRVRSLMESWWKEFHQSSRRDQLSLPYVAWKTGFGYRLVDEGPRLGSEYYRLHPHLSSGPRHYMSKLWILSRARRDEGLGYWSLFYLIKACKIARGEGLTALLRATKRKIKNRS